MNYRKRKTKILLLPYLCVFSILISLTSTDLSLSVFKSHASLINQTEIELVILDNPEKYSWEYKKASGQNYSDNPSELTSRGRLYEILEKYNVIIRHLYRVQKNVENINQGTYLFLHLKCRSGLHADNDQSLDV